MDSNICNTFFIPFCENVCEFFPFFPIEIFCTGNTHLNFITTFSAIYLVNRCYYCYT